MDRFEAICRAVARHRGIQFDIDDVMGCIDVLVLWREGNPNHRVRQAIAQVHPDDPTQTWEELHTCDEFDGLVDRMVASL